MRTVRAALGVLALSAASAALGSIARTTDPALSPDGQTLAFVWQGDVWTVPAKGGEARRLTVHPGEDTWPKWSPDGRTLVFASDRFGSLDLFAMEPDGTGVRRLTFDSASEFPTSFSPDGQTVVGHTNAWGRMDLFRVPLTGGETIRLTGHPLELEYYATVSPDGRFVAYNSHGGPGNWRKPGFGGAGASSLFLAEYGVPLTAHRPLWESDHNDLWPVFLSAREVAFVSNRGGAPNVWVGTIGGNPKALTEFADGTIRALSASRDGKTLAFQKDSRIWVIDRATRRAAPVEIMAPADAPRNPVQRLDLSTGAGAMAVSPNGKRAVLAVRGDLFLIPERGGTTRRLTTSPRLDSQPVWLDDQTVLYVASAEKGRRELWTVALDGTAKPFLTDALDLNSPALSPDRKTVALHRGDREIVVVPAAGGTPRVLATGDFGSALMGAPQFNWSPDGAWLVFQRTLSRSVENAVVKVEGGETLTVARVGKGSSVPLFTADGRGIVFSITEGLNYSESRNSTSPLAIVDLVPADITFTEDDLDKLDEPKKEEPKEVTVKIEPRGLLERRRTLTTTTAGSLASGPDGKVVYANVDGQFSTVDVKTGAVRPVAGVTGSVSSPELSPDRRKLYFLQAGRPFALTFAGGAVAPVAFSAQFTVDAAQEEQALFEEVWWALDRMYYDPKMQGKDWAAIKERFRPLVPKVQSREDFYALMAEMLEQLDSSHLGATPPATAPREGREETAWLGVEWDWAALAARGEYRVAKVYGRGPSALPTSELRPGDRVTRVDGVAPTPDRPVARLLEGRAGRRVVLTVEREVREVEVAIQPVRPTVRTGALYEDWVAWNRATVDRLSQGRLGYLHIEGMDAPSLDRFLVESATLLEGKSGYVVDVRYNGGGFTSHIILNLMRKEPWLIRTTRDRPGVEVSENIWRGNSIELPAACLINGSSFSNAEIFAEGFRQLKLGPIVGVPTAGGVIGTGGYGLWDGGSVRMPGSGAFALDGENLEGNGRRPDILVPWDPNSWQAGADPQLERVVAELLRRLD